MVSTWVHAGSNKYSGNMRQQMTTIAAVDEANSLVVVRYYAKDIFLLNIRALSLRSIRGKMM